jgi:hypothetical protein
MMKQVVRKKGVLATQCQNASLPVLEKKALEDARTGDLSEMATAAQWFCHHSQL